MTILYAGPSWANRSYDTDDDDYQYTTNLYKELDLDVKDISIPGSNNLEQLTLIEKNIITYDINKIIYIMCEPLSQLNDITLTKILTNENLHTYRYELMHKTLTQLNNLNIDVGLIGGHAGIFKNITKDMNNITVIHDSWQQFLCDYCNIINTANWGADVLHVTLSNNLNIKPSISIINDLYNAIHCWKLLQQNEVFYDVHPNYNGNQLFANAIRNKVYEWIDE